MHVETLSWSQREGWRRRNTTQIKPNLVLYFGVRERLSDGVRYRELRTMFPDACLMGCTTGGQIHNDDIVDDEIGAVALHFEQTKLRAACEMVAGAEASRRCGEAIGNQLMADDLAGVFVLSDGLNVNGSELAAGIGSKVGPKVSITGGLAGDGSAFKETLVGIDCPPRSRAVAAIGFYGRAVRIGSGSAGGWDVFGPRRRITRSKGNLLFELDGEPALDLYERYLGEDEVRGLPGTALLFPLQIYNPARSDHKVVRTVLSVDRAEKSMTFAGDMPEGFVAQMMRGNFDRLAAGAADAAQQARSLVQADKGVAILVSCIGRRLLMGQQTKAEVEAAASALGSQLARLGFYSYGEISPHAVSGLCELHNQTMTVTTITEAAA